MNEHSAIYEILSRVFREKRQAGKRNFLGAVGFQHHAVIGCPHPSDGGYTLKACLLYRRRQTLSIREHCPISMRNSARKLSLQKFSGWAFGDFSDDAN